MREHINGSNRDIYYYWIVKVTALVTVLVILGGIACDALDLSIAAQGATNVYSWSCMFYLDYNDDDTVTFKCDMSAYPDCLPANRRVGSSIYAITPYMRTSESIDGVWQVFCDLERADFIKIGEFTFENAVLSDGVYRDSITFDITHLYDTPVFEEYFAQVSDINPFKEMSSGYFKFYGKNFWNRIMMFLYNSPNEPTWQQLYDHVSETYYTKYNEPRRSNFSDYYLTVYATRAVYNVNGGEWIAIDNHEKKFYYSDYNDGDVIGYKVIYKDGYISDVAYHTINKTKVHVDPDGGSVNGKTKPFTMYDDASLANAIYIAAEGETKPKFGSLVIEKPGYEFGGFEIVEGNGRIIKKLKYDFYSAATFYDGRINKDRTFYYRPKTQALTDYPTPESMRKHILQYFRDYTKEVPQIVYDDTRIAIDNRRKNCYYVESDDSEVWVKAIWISEEEAVAKRIPWLIKIGDTAYESDLVTRRAVTLSESDKQYINNRMNKWIDSLANPIIIK